jgi:hypothetical protein
MKHNRRLKTHRNRLLGPLLIAPIVFSLLGINFQIDLKQPNRKPLVPTCIDRKSIPASELHWLYLPQSSEELNTYIPLTFLAGKLIGNDVVDVSSCSDGGLLSNGAASPCGLDLALPLVFELQNIYDDEIFNAGLQIGTPPVMLKQVFRHESQFWPGRHDAIHFSLGHLTPWGASTALLWNKDLLQEVCQTAYGQPCVQYIQTRNVLSDPLVGTLLDMVTADCEECALKIDIPKAEASVELFAQVMMAHCTQASQVIYNVTEEHSSESVSYTNIWKMTLFNYNVGSVCLEDTLEAILKEDPDTLEFLWVEFEEHVPKSKCQVGLDYVEKITTPITGTRP